MFQFLEIIGYVIIGIGIILMFIGGILATKAMFSNNQDKLKTNLVKGLKYFGLSIPVLVIGFVIGIYGSSSLSHQRVPEVYVLTEEDIHILNKNRDELSEKDIIKIHQLTFSHLSPQDIEKYYDKLKEASIKILPPTYPEDLFEKNFKETTIYKDKHEIKE